MKLKAAHFLLTPNLWNSPPNDALARAYRQCGYDLDMYSPNVVDDYAHLQSAEYGIRWILKNAFKLKWRNYGAFSCTTEDPVVVAAILALIWRKPLIVLADEIKSGSYYGDRAEYWKKLCRWALRRAQLTIVNDQTRISLQREYTGQKNSKTTIVYPGCFLETPIADPRATVHSGLNIGADKLVLGFSGFCSIQNGIDWALESLQRFPELIMLTQPLTVDALPSYLLSNHRSYAQLRISSQRLTWQESWSSMGGVDIGVSIYRDPAPQFQNMGISSNRLCMFLAMGVPVIVSKQASFQFIEDYNCGILVANSDEFNAAIASISKNLPTMKKNALKCAQEYIKPGKHFIELEVALGSVLKSV